MSKHRIPYSRIYRDFMGNPRHSIIELSIKYNLSFKEIEDAIRRQGNRKKR